jgi:hypothetical protein
LRKAYTLRITVLAWASFTSALAYASQPQFTFTPPPTWQKGAIKQVDAGWMLKDSPTKASITITTDTSDDAFDFKGIDEEQLVRLIETTRAFPYKIFGIKNWKVEKHNIKTIPNGVRLELQGHYVSTSGTRVHYIEHDYFIGKTSYAVSFFEDENGSPIQSDADIEKLLSLFQTETGHQ